MHRLFIFIRHVLLRIIMYGKMEPRNIQELGDICLQSLGINLLTMDFVFAEAMDAEILAHYQKHYGAELFPYGAPPHPYRFIINEGSMKKIMEEYNYDDADEEI